MPTYTASFRTDAEHAAITLEARNPKAALAKAQDLWEQNQSALTFQRYDEIQPLNEIEITTPSGKPVADWLDEDMHLRLSAEQMRSALMLALAALNSAPRFKVLSLDTDSYRIARECEAALAEACGER